MPRHSQPRLMAETTAARITAFRPGASPPPVLRVIGLMGVGGGSFWAVRRAAGRGMASPQEDQGDSTPEGPRFRLSSRGSGTGGRSMGKWIGLGCLGILVVVLLVGGLVALGSYNSLVGLDQGVNAQWAQVENVYQRRADLIPNLVATVQGAANFEKSTLEAVTEARASVGRMQVNLGNLPNDPSAFAKFDQAQAGLSSALSRLMVVVERYPELKANQNFRDLQVQLEGTENRISVERMRYN